MCENLNIIMENVIASTNHNLDVCGVCSWPACVFPKHKKLSLFEICAILKHQYRTEYAQRCYPQLLASHQMKRVILEKKKMMKRVVLLDKNKLKGVVALSQINEQMLGTN